MFQTKAQDDRRQDDVPNSVEGYLGDSG